MYRRANLGGESLSVKEHRPEALNSWEVGNQDGLHLGSRNLGGAPSGHYSVVGSIFTQWDCQLFLL